MIMKIFTDTSNISHHTNTQLLEVLAWPNTGEQEQLRGIDGATAKDDLFVLPDLLFAAILKRDHTHRPCSVKQDAPRQPFRPAGEARKAHHWMQISAGAA